MKMAHPTCTELESWHPADKDSAVARHLSVCARCRRLQTLLTSELDELERVAPLAGFLARAEALDDDSIVTTTGEPRSHTMDLQQALAGARASSARAEAELELDAASGLVWIDVQGRRTAIGDAGELRAYLEGAWLEGLFCDGATELDAALESELRAEIDAALERLRPRLETIGWFDAPSVVTSRPRPQPQRRLGFRLLLAAAPFALLLLVWQNTLLPTRLPGAATGPGLAASASESADLVSKGTRGVPALVVMVKRGDTVLEYADRAVVMPGDRLRLRFRRDQAGPVAAGILTESREWIPFFEQECEAGEHSPHATLRVDERPGSGRVLLGEPGAVQAAVKGGSEAGLSVIELVWKPAASQGQEH
jgi:hypothetical protein